MSNVYESTGNFHRISAAETTQVKDSGGTLKRIIIVAGTVDVFNDPDSDDNQVIDDLTSSEEFDIYLDQGIRVVTTGATVEVLVVFR